MGRGVVAAAPPADWPTLLRRAALDLAGRIPRLAEYRWLESLPDDARRHALVEHLMALVDCDLHLRNVLEEQLRTMEQSDKAGNVLFPDFSPRRELGEVALQDSERRFLARNIVNRTWQRLMGTALVDPPDPLHAANPPSHPELLDWLTRDLVDHRHDLRRLVRGIVLSDAYARSSRWTSADAPRRSWPTCRRSTCCAPPRWPGSSAGRIGG